MGRRASGKIICRGSDKLIVVFYFENCYIFNRRKILCESGSSCRGLREVVSGADQIVVVYVERVIKRICRHYGEIVS